MILVCPNCLDYHTYFYAYGIKIDVLYFYDCALTMNHHFIEIHYDPV